MGAPFWVTYIVLWLICRIAVCAPSDDILQGHTNEEEWWSINIDAGTDIMLNCTEQSLPDLSSWQNMTWVLPDMTLIPREGQREFTTQDGVVNMAVSADGELLAISNIQEDFFGLYYCVVFSDTNTFFVTRRGINMEWSYREEIWDKYQMYIVIIGITAGLFAALAIAIAVVALWCKRSAERQEEHSTRSTSEVVKTDLSHVYVNGNASAVRARPGKNTATKELPLVEIIPREKANLDCNSQTKM